jgi:hypothetical protein
MATYVGDKAEQAGDSKALEVLARIGLGRLRRRTPPGRWLALQIAWGLTRSDSADTSGP